MYYLLINGQRTGPYTAHDVRQFLQRGAVGFETLFWKDGMSDWHPVGASRHLFGIGPSVTREYRQGQPFPGNQPPHGSQQVVYHQPAIMIQPVMMAPYKSRAAFVLLGLFLGGLGIHNFYAGYSGKGIAQLLLNLFLFWTIIVPIGIGIWVLIEVITVDRDGYGNRFG